MLWPCRYGNLRVALLGLVAGAALSQLDAAECMPASPGAAPTSRLPLPHPPADATPLILRASTAHWLPPAMRPLILLALLALCSRIAAESELDTKVTLTERVNDNPSNSEHGCEVWSQGKDVAWCNDNINSGVQSSVVSLPNVKSPA